MNRAWIVLVSLIAIGCPPPWYIDVYNNTGEQLQIHAAKQEYSLAPGESMNLESHELFFRWADLDGDGTRWPILQLEVGGRLAEYRYSLPIPDEFVRRNGSVTYAFVQVERDLTVVIAKPDDQRPVPPGYTQPMRWPLRPLARAGPPSNKPLKLTAAGFGDAGGRARHESW
jgi:hypothetical protein